MAKLAWQKPQTPALGGAAAPASCKGFWLSQRLGCAARVEHSHVTSAALLLLLPQLSFLMVPFFLPKRLNATKTPLPGVAFLQALDRAGCGVTSDEHSVVSLRGA